MHSAEAGNQQSIGLVRLGAREAGLPEGLDLGGIDDTDGVALGVKEAGQRVAVSAGGLQADVDGAARPPCLQPFLKPPEARRCVGERLMARLALNGFALNTVAWNAGAGGVV